MEEGATVGEPPGGERATWGCGILLAAEVVGDAAAEVVGVDVRTGAKGSRFGAPDRKPIRLAESRFEA